MDDLSAVWKRRASLATDAAWRSVSACTQLARSAEDGAPILPIFARHLQLDGHAAQQWLHRAKTLLNLSVDHDFEWCNGRIYASATAAAVNTWSRLWHVLTMNSSALGPTHDDFDNPDGPAVSYMDQRFIANMHEHHEGMRDVVRSVMLGWREKLTSLRIGIEKESVRMHASVPQAVGVSGPLDAMGLLALDALATCCDGSRITDVLRFLTCSEEAEETRQAVWSAIRPHVSDSIEDIRSRIEAFLIVARRALLNRPGPQLLAVLSQAIQDAETWIKATENQPADAIGILFPSPLLPLPKNNWPESITGEEANHWYTRLAFRFELQRSEWDRRAALAEVLNKRETAKADLQTESYLGIEVDREKRLIRRSGFDHVADLSDRSSLWPWFDILLGKRGEKVSKNDRVRISDGITDSGHKGAARELRDLLSPIGLTVRDYRLLDSGSTD